jgi:Asp-tRNA(Asn)/Glu-tRNA(Gln) amidotransferase A subunit family amidase
MAQPALIRSIRDGLRNKQHSAAEVVGKYLDVIARTDHVVGAFISIDSERALQQVSPTTLKLERTAADEPFGAGACTGQAHREPRPR